MANEEHCLSNTHFYLIELNLLEEKASIFKPQEVSIVDFTFKDGIRREFCEIMGPNSVPTINQLIDSAKFDANSFALSLTANPNATQDYAVLFDKIIAFCSNSIGNVIQLFCLEEKLPLYQSSLDYISTKAAQRGFLSNKRIVFRNFSSILAKMGRSVDSVFLKNFETSVQTEYSLKMKEDTDCFKKTPACIFHQSVGSYTCALRRCKTLYDSIVDRFCSLLKVDNPSSFFNSFYQDDLLYAATSSINDRIDELDQDTTQATPHFIFGQPTSVPTVYPAPEMPPKEFMMKKEDYPPSTDEDEGLDNLTFPPEWESCFDYFTLQQIDPDFLAQEESSETVVRGLTIETLNGDYEQRGYKKIVPKNQLKQL